MAAPKKPTNTTPKSPRGEIKVSSNVKVIPGKMGQSVRASSVNEKTASGADQAKAQNARSMAAKKTTKAETKALKNVNNPKKSSTDPRGKANVKALKAANKSTNKTGSAMNKLERKYYNKLSATEQNKMLKGLQDVEQAGLSKTTRNTTKGSVKTKTFTGRGSGRGGGLNINDLNR